MALQLLGGPIRFSPKNSHQKPSVLVLANMHTMQGAYTLCAARLLAIRGVRCHIFVPDCPSSPRDLSRTLGAGTGGDDTPHAHCRNELAILLSTETSSHNNCAQLLAGVDDVKHLSSVDLILNGLDSSETAEATAPAKVTAHIWYRQLVKYVESVKASVLAIDPSVQGSALASKWCITPVLPMCMSANCGRV